VGNLRKSVHVRSHTKGTIKLTIHDWTGQYLTTHIMGEVLKKAGYNIEYVQADYIAQFRLPDAGGDAVSRR